MINKTHFRPYEPNQLLLLPPALQDWLPADHLAYFICDVVNMLDLSEIYASYDGSLGGQPPYNPGMMTKLLLYAYCVGVPSSRKIEKNTYESIPFRVISASQHPDHDTIAAFRRRHLKALSALFVEVLLLCREAGLVKLGHVALDGTKFRANASKHKSMSYGRMETAVKALEEEVTRLMAKADAADAEEDAAYVQGKGGHGLSDELKFKQNRLNTLRIAKKALEEQAQEQAEAKETERKELEERYAKEGKTVPGTTPKKPSRKPHDKAQRNFTDPDSKIMKDGATHSFEQSYNCQAAADADSQVIVGRGVTQQANDKQQVKPLIEDIKTNLS